MTVHAEVVNGFMDYRQTARNRRQIDWNRVATRILRWLTVRNHMVDMVLDRRDEYYTSPHRIPGFGEY